MILDYLNNCTVKLEQFREKISQLLIWSDISTVLEKSTIWLYFVCDLAQGASTFLQ